MFVEGKSRTVFFPSDTLIYGISRDGSKNFNIRTCEHMILGQLRMGARQTNYAPLVLLFIQFFVYGFLSQHYIFCAYPFKTMQNHLEISSKTQVWITYFFT